MSIVIDGDVALLGDDVVRVPLVGDRILVLGVEVIAGHAAVLGRSSHDPRLRSRFDLEGDRVDVLLEDKGPEDGDDEGQEGCEPPKELNDIRTVEVFIVDILVCIGTHY